MNRRNFLGISASLAAGFAVTKTLAKPETLKDQLFTLDILTDKPDIAINNAEKLLADLNLKRINFTENIMSGQFLGDIAFTYNNKLINYKESHSVLSNQLKNLSQTLGLPKTFVNPVLISFKSGASQKAEYFEIFKNGEIIDRLPINTNKRIDVSTDKGNLVVALGNNSAQVLESNCKHKTCIQYGKAFHAADQVICIPSNIRITLSGNNRFGLDAISY